MEKFANLVPRIFSLSNMATAGEKTLAQFSGTYIAESCDRFVQGECKFI